MQYTLIECADAVTQLFEIFTLPGRDELDRASNGYIRLMYDIIIAWIGVIVCTVTNCPYAPRRILPTVLM
jgi:hypothetical protein